MAAKGTKTLTIKDLKTHATPDDLYVLIHGKGRSIMFFLILVLDASLYSPK